VQQSYEIGRVPRTLVGPGALSALPGALESLGAHSVVVVVDGAVAAGEHLGRLMTVLGPIPSVVHVTPPGEPTVDSVDAAADLVRATPGAVVIGVGGGSALDIAKQAATVGAGETGVEPYLLCATPLPGRRPIIAIPTTSGTGAEVTRTCIVSDRSGRKVWTWGDEMLPDLVVLDPTATVTMPRAVTVGTGLDAFVHAMEACSGARRSSVAAAPAQRALRLVVEHLPRAVADPADLAARLGMQEAAYLAGIAIDNCGTGVAHSIGHAMGTLHHVPHGVSVAVGLRSALDWNVDGEPGAFVDAAAALDCELGEVPARFEQLTTSVDLGGVVRGLGIGHLDPDRLGETMAAPENQPMLQNNAHHVDDDARWLLSHRTAALWNELVRSPA
jgi:alcohol dehydrogenase class IV